MIKIIDFETLNNIFKLKTCSRPSNRSLPLDEALYLTIFTT